MNKFWVVALETYKRNVKSVTFLVMILAPFLMVGFSLLMGKIGASFGETSNIAVIASNKELRQSYLAISPLTVNGELEKEEAAIKALEKEEIDGYLIIGYEAKDGVVSGEYVGSSPLGMSDQLSISQALSSIQLAGMTADLGLDQQAVAKLTSSVALTEKTVEFKDGKMTEKGGNKLALQIVAYFISFAMYMIILMYAQITSQEVASEKGTRIMEIILSSTSAAKHFYGKVMGIFLVILTQVIVYLLTGVGAFTVAQDMPMVKDVLEIIPMNELIKSLLGYNLLYLLFGVLIYTILAALCGSLVSKSEDAGKAAVPVTYVTLIGFMISMMFGMSNPQHIVMKVSSFVPFVSSFTMPARIASGTVTDGSVLVSLGLLALATILLLKLSATMYRSTALVYSDQSMWKTLKQSFTGGKK